MLRSIKGFTLLLCILFSFNNLQANHLISGEISWECLNNGKYVFKLKVYRDCSGLPAPTTNRQIGIIGNPLPRNSANALVSSITVRLDTSNWIARRFGNVSPLCKNDQGLDCSNGDAGAVQQMTFLSDTISLIGTPPSNGWMFYHDLPCCRPNISNLAAAGSHLLRAFLYANSPASSPTSCVTSSPTFSEVPDYLACKGRLSKLDYSATDKELDSLSYSWERTYNAPATAPQPVPYANGYNFNNPTPNTSFNVNNIPATLDPMTGIISYKVNSSNNLLLDYFIGVRVDAWRNGSVVSSAIRELPNLIVNCPNLTSSTENTPPIITPPFTTASNQPSFNDTVVVGSSVGINLSILDTNMVGSNFQNIAIEVWGNKMSKTMNLATNCPDPNDNDCAAFISNPQYDAFRKKYYYIGSPSFNSFLSWQTNCDDLDSIHGAKTHIFYVRATDDFCPIPGVEMQTIKITVLPSISVCPNISTSIEEAGDAVSNISFYPNPSKGVVFIEGLKETVDYQIFNIQGKLMKRGRLAANQKQLDLPEAEGLYFVSIRDESGNEKTYKLIKQ